ncbi:MAG: hypothetical protein EHM79_05610 [Geobacter sp.]|nr:MAG: hypothetical protein EHM79_05610 [Geobacter sp.]
MSSASILTLKGVAAYLSLPEVCSFSEKLEQQLFDKEDQALLQENLDSLKKAICQVLVSIKALT